MQNTQLINEVQLTKVSWFVNKCRQGIFDALNKLEDACVEIIEQGNVISLGNRNSQLIGQMHVLDMNVYSDIVKGGGLGAAQAYIDKKWDSPDLTKLIRVFARSQKILDALEKKSTWANKLQLKLLSWKNRNTQAGSKKNILAHYDLGNELYTRFLDDKMMYSSAIYQQPDMTLSEAQTAKLALICEKLSLKSTDHLIEIGTGWGGLAIYAATHYDCHVTTTTISDEQYIYALEQVKSLGLEDKITLLNKDYRLVEGCYDKLVSIEMIEAVGHEFMGEFFEKCSSLLKPDGKMLLQAITINDQRYDEYRKSIDFINKYIFPGGCLPSIAVISQHVAQSTDMMIDNVQDIGLHYARTLHDWRVNFDNQWHDIKVHGYDEQFQRLWHYYFSYCEGAFIERVISTHHVVARKPRYIDDHDEAILCY
jgi:cyclopropane-fatty-acyl-phospholipid synthase